MRILVVSDRFVLSTLLGATWVVAAAVGGLAALGLYASRSWGIFHDAPLMFYVAQQMAEGHAPYRDILDMNMPGAYLVAWAMLSGFGLNDLAWRLLDQVVVVSIAASAFFLVRPANAILAAMAGGSIVLFHLGAGPNAVGQRDFLMILPVLLSANLLVVAIEGALGRQRSAAIFGAGALLGIAVTLKPTAILLIPAALLLLVASDGRSVETVRHIAALLLGALLTLGVVSAWLFFQGVLDDFLMLQWLFVIPSYGPIHMERSSYIGSVFALTALIAVPIASASRYSRRYVVMVALVGFGLVHFHIQRKYWPYHSEPLAIFSLIATFLGLAILVAHLHQSSSLLSALLAILIVQLVMLGCAAERFNIRQWLSGRAATGPNVGLVESLQWDIQGFSATKQSIQPLDTTHGVIAAMLRVGISAPTRMMYAFPLYLERRTPYLEELREEFLRDMRANGYPPIVRTNQQWPYEQGYSRLEAWPAFRDLIDEHYTLSIERVFPDDKGYRIYVARRS